MQLLLQINYPHWENNTAFYKTITACDLAFRFLRLPCVCRHRLNGCFIVAVGQTVSAHGYPSGRVQMQHHTGFEVGWTVERSGMYELVFQFVIHSLTNSTNSICSGSLQLSALPACHL
ncbi:hypothetical protein AMECASPLE_005657 [Ameca splendens]|uniref:Uncharacterized protein n=1 Tax=Ameca splendens TaxID=208324 RepID=A0ABV0YA55_9TELE